MRWSHWQKTKLFAAVNITRRISEFICQWVPDRRTSDRKSPGTAVRVESTAMQWQLVYCANGPHDWSCSSVCRSVRLACTAPIARKLKST